MRKPLDQLNLGKIPPQATELEDAILGAVMTESSVADKVISILAPECFYRPENGLIFNSIVELKKAGNPIDILTVTKHLRSVGKLEDAGGAFRITELTSNVLSSANAEHHSMIVFQEYAKREMIKAGSEMVDNMFSGGELLDGVDVMTKTISNLLGGVDSVKTKTLAAASWDFMEQLDLMAASGKDIIGVPSGISKLDYVLSGFQGGRVTIIAGRPGHGKSALAMQIAKGVSERGKSVYVLSLEMPAMELAQRLIANEAGIDLDRLSTGQITEGERLAMNKALGVFESWNFVIDDASNTTITKLRAKVMAQHAKKPLGMFIVDYLQLMSGESKKGNREQEISEISRGLKVLAKDLNIPVIALAQLNRECENRADKKPMLSDLRESGSIEQDADAVIFFVNFSQYPEITTNYKGEDLEQGEVALIVAKNRGGKVKGLTKIFFHQSQMRITDGKELVSQSFPTTAIKPNTDFEKLKGRGDTPF